MLKDIFISILLCSAWHYLSKRKKESHCSFTIRYHLQLSDPNLRLWTTKKYMYNSFTFTYHSWNYLTLIFEIRIFLMREILNFFMRFVFYCPQSKMILTAPIWQLQEVQVSVDCFCWSGKCLLNIFLFLAPHDWLCRNIFPLDLARPVSPLPEYLRTYWTEFSMGIIIDIHPTLLLQPELTHIVTLSLRAEEVMLELGKLWQKSRQFLSAHQLGGGGAL